MPTAIDQPDFAVVDPLDLEALVSPLDAAPPPAGNRSRYKWAKWAVAIGLVLILGVTVELWRIHSASAIGYQTVLVERGVIQASVTATGTLNAVVDVQVGSQVSGNIKALYADFNSKVAKDQLVALIDPEVFQA